MSQQLEPDHQLPPVQLGNSDEQTQLPIDQNQQVVQRQQDIITL